MTTATTTPEAGAKTFYADDALWIAAKEYAEKHPRVKSVSRLIEKLLIAEIRKNGRKVGVRVPQHFLTR